MAKYGFYPEIHLYSLCFQHLPEACEWSSSKYLRMSYIDIFQAHTKEMLEEYKKSMSCYIETHLISLKKKADRINNQNVS